MRAVPEELTILISDLESFLSDGLKGENLSKKAKEKKETFIKRIKEVKQSFPQDFKDKSEDSDDEEDVDSNNDGGSLQSERTDKDEDACEGTQLAVPAQELTSVVKAGYLEKRRKDHSFFGTEWQKRWCALTHQTFYYYGSEKDKQQKGEFCITGYSVKMNNTLRKDSKKEFCFEISAHDKRIYQFCALSAKEAEEWVKEIDFVLKDLSGIIPEEEDDDQGLYDDVDTVQAHEQGDDIYEVLPEEEMLPPPPPPIVEPSNQQAASPAVDKSTDYENYYQGLWDCVGNLPDELSFKRGDAIYILSKEYNNFGWWVGEKNGAIGIVPKRYLTQLYIL